MAATKSQLELALRLKTDLDAGRRELQGLGEDLTGVKAKAEGSNAALGASGAALGKQSSSLAAATLSTKQYQQALRMLPMQITDVVTSLSSGMPVWMVAIQQGGQLKDSFGGVGNAAKALVSSIKPATLAIGGVGGAVAALALAYIQGSNEAIRFRETLILTGNAAGVTAGSLVDMSERLDDSVGTQREAAAALNQIAGTSRFTAEQIELIGSAAVALSNVTDVAVGDLIKQFTELSKDPVKAVATLNEQYNFLTASVYSQIEALERQGKTSEATALAIDTLGKTLLSRSEDIQQNLGWLERGWNAVGSAAGEAWDFMLNIGREDSLQSQLAALDQQIDAIESRRSQGQTRGGAGQVGGGNLDSLKTQRAELQAQVEQEKADADEAKRQKQLTDLRIKQTTAATDFIDVLQRQQDKQEELSNSEKATALIKEQGIELSSELATRLLAEAAATDQQVAASEAAAEAQRAEQQAKREAEQASKAAERAAASLSAEQLRYVQSLERQAAQLGFSSSQTRAYELAEKNLSGTLRERAEASLAVLEADEQRRKAEQNQNANTALAADYQRATGNDSAAQMIELQAEMDQLRSQFVEDGNEIGLAWIEQLIPVQEASIRLQALQTEADRILGSLGSSEQSLDVQVDAGLISEVTAQEQLVELYRQSREQLTPLVAQMEQLAQATGNPDLVAGVEAYKLKLQETHETASLLVTTLKNGLENGIASALTGLATGTMDLQEAAEAFVNSIATSMAQLAAQQLAQQAVSGISGLFGASSGASDAAGLTTGAAAVTGSATALSAAGGSLLTGAAAIQSAAASLAAANGLSSTSSATSSAVSSTTGSTGSSSSSWLSTAASIASLFFAEGGQVQGPGSGTSDSIPAMLSNGEFVTRAAVVSQPGALDFLQRFNRYGLSALAPAHHASGGLAGYPAPALPSPSLSDSSMGAASSSSTTLQNAVNIHLVQSDEDVAAKAWSKPGQQHFVSYLQKNSASVRQILGVR
jgi:phage-related minor tail protein